LHFTFRPLHASFVLAFVIAILSGFNPLVFAQSPRTWYVAPTGNDSNAGTSSAPFLTIQRAANLVNPGDTVIVEDGVYTGVGTGTSCALSTSRPVVCLSRAGSSSAWVTFKARNRGKAIVDGQNNTSTHGFRFLSGANYIRIEGFQIRGVGSTTNGASGILIYSGGHDVEIVNNEIHSIGRLCTDHQYGMNAIFVQNARVTIDGNRIHKIGRFAAGESGCNPSTTNYQNHDHGIYINGKSDGSAPGASDIVVKNNEFYNLQRGWGIQVYPALVDRLQILNNTFAFENPYRDGHIIFAASTSNAVVQNNIFFRPRTVALNFNAGTHTAMDVSNNIVYGASLMKSVSGVTAANNQVTDPLFVNAATSPYDFQLTAPSPAVNQGLTQQEVTDDFAGKARSDGYNDIGSHEHGATTTTPPPPTTGDTTAPTVSITSPANNTRVSGWTTVSATATDNVGVVSVVFAVDGKTIGSDTSAPYSIRWRARGLTYGSHTLTATAKDAAGNTKVASITVQY
jgi:hypothetical protein